MIATTAIEAAARTVLNGITDPCSVRAGVPAGLIDMGLVHALTVAATPCGWRIEAVLGVTDPTCLMAAVFLQEAHARLGAIGDVAEVHCTLDHGTIWTPKRLAPEYAARLTAARAARRASA